jgi:ribosomal protein S18 acetylase RimI-like enzyme
MAVFSPEIFLQDTPAQLRQGGWANDPEFLEILRVSWRRQYAEYVGDAAARDYVARLERQGRLFSHHEPLTIHAWVDKRIVGISALRPLGALDLITMLEVHPEFRGRGIGEQLLTALTSTGNRVMAHVSIHQPRVLAFYVRQGFHVLERTHVKHGPHRLEFDVVASPAAR